MYQLHNLFTFRTDKTMLRLLKITVVLIFFLTIALLQSCKNCDAECAAAEAQKDSVIAELRVATFTLEVPEFECDPNNIVSSVKHPATFNEAVRYIESFKSGMPGFGEKTCMGLEVSKSKFRQIIPAAPSVNISHSGYFLYPILVEGSFGVAIIPVNNFDGCEPLPIDDALEFDTSMFFFKNELGLPLRGHLEACNHQFGSSSGALRGDQVKRFNRSFKERINSIGAAAGERYARIADEPFAFFHLLEIQNLLSQNCDVIGIRFYFGLQTDDAVTCGSKEYLAGEHLRLVGYSVNGRGITGREFHNFLRHPDGSPAYIMERTKPPFF